MFDDIALDGKLIYCWLERMNFCFSAINLNIDSVAKLCMIRLHWSMLWRVEVVAMVSAVSSVVSLRGDRRCSAIMTFF